MTNRITITDFIRWIDKVASSDPDRIVGKPRDPSASPVCVYVKDRHCAVFAMLMPHNDVVYAEFTGFFTLKTHYRNYRLPTMLWELTDRVWHSEGPVTVRQCVKILSELGYAIVRPYPIRMWPDLVDKVRSVARSKWQRNIIEELVSYGYIRYPVYNLPRALRNSYGSSYSVSADNLLGRLNDVLNPYRIKVIDGFIVDPDGFNPIRPMRYWYVTVKI